GAGGDGHAVQNIRGDEVQIEADWQAAGLVAGVRSVHQPAAAQLVLEPEAVLMRIGQRPGEVLRLYGLAEVGGQAVAGAGGLKKSGGEQGGGKGIAEVHRGIISAIGGSDQRRGLAETGGWTVRVLTKIGKAVAAPQHPLGREAPGNTEAGLDV